MNWIKTKPTLFKYKLCYVDLKDHPKSFNLFERKKIRYKIEGALERKDENWVMLFVSISKKYANDVEEIMERLKSNCSLCDYSYDSYCKCFEEMLKKIPALQL